jgi:hypothetical protein
MSFFNGIFGPSRDEVWKELSQQIGADFIDGGFWRGDKVQAHVKSWTVTLDTYTVSTGKSHHTFTRIRAPFCTRGDFRFKIYRRGIFSAVGKFLGMMDIEVGHSVKFDEDFIIQSNDDSKVKAVLADPEIRRLLEAQPTVQLELKDGEGGLFGRFPEEVDELAFHIHGVLKDVGRLKLLFDLFAVVLDRLAELGLATEEAPSVAL